VTNEQSLIDVIDAVNRQFGSIDVLVNSVGIAVTDTAEQLAVMDWDQTMAINLRGAFLVSQQIGRIMLAQRSGTVISLTSQAATIALPGHLAYCASKAGLVGMTKPVTSSVSEDTLATTRSAGSVQRSRMNRQASTTCVGWQASGVRLVEQEVKIETVPQRVARAALQLDERGVNGSSFHAQTG
jgi:NAD(P)-dependent dehydrogenase (short-subunit alcohol dehydrogenase family)